MCDCNKCLVQKYLNPHVNVFVSPPFFFKIIPFQIFIGIVFLNFFHNIEICLLVAQIENNKGPKSQH